MTIATIRNICNNLLAILMVTLLVACGGGGSSTPEDPLPVADTVPDTFSFTDQEDVEFDILVQSAPITISGIDAASTISVTGGEYSIDGASFVSDSGSVSNGQTIIVQQTSAATSKTITDVILTIGGVSDTFSVTTVLVLNEDFVEKAELITLNSINVYDGYINIDDAGILEPDFDNLNSGDLLTIDIEFDLSELLVEEYLFRVQLMPQSVVSQFGEGETLGKIMTQDLIANEGEEVIDLGGALVEVEVVGENHALLHAKLPALSQNIEYRIMVTPEVSFLASNNEPQLEELAIIPVLIKDEVLTINKLDLALVSVIEPPVLLDNNDFTQVEIAGTFDNNGFSSKPIFQSQIDVDVTSFNPTENIELTMSWTTSKGDTFQLGLLSVDDSGGPVVSDKAIFEVPRDGGQSIQLPVVAYVTEPTQIQMLAFATPIREIADNVPESANFVLDIKIVDEQGNTGDSAASFDFNLPLVSQDLRAMIQADDDIIKYTVLRAGETNSACLFVPVDIDTDLIIAGSNAEVFAATCNDPREKQLWRYDRQTLQLISKVLDTEGGNYCLTLWSDNIFPNTYRATRCEFDPENNNLGHVNQRFHFEEGEPIESDLVPTYLDVEFSNSTNQVVVLDYDILGAPNFFTDSEGVDIDRKGRVFNVGDSQSYQFGDDDIVSVEVSYGGESSINFKPVPGVVAKGNAALTATVFNSTNDLVVANFEYQNHLTKQLTFLAGNLTPVQVKNGAQAKFQLLGVDVATLGEMEESTVSESFLSSDSAEDAIDDAPDAGEIVGIDFGNDDYERELFNITIIVYGIPLKVAGSLEGALTLKGDLSEIQPLGVSADIESNMRLAAVLSASADAGIAEAGIDATITIIDKTLSFDASGQFNASTDLTAPKITYTTDVNVELDIDILNGKIEAFVEYYRPCPCLSLVKKVRKEITLYQSPSAFSSHTNFYKGEATALEFKL
ncbi:MAG: hypothetical protein KUG78_01370 [Kangiellaceae bacterium]|nr:hypothetical protein [Kangiellaceae bacterium]